MKTCTKCGRSLPADHFHVKDIRNGVRRMRGDCRDCCKEYQTQRRAKLQQVIPDSKVCPRCTLSLPASEFTRDSYTATGLGTYCTTCRRAKGQERSKQAKIDPPAEKQCAKCGLVADPSMFAKCSTGLDGLKTSCRGCDRWKSIHWMYNLTREQYHVLSENGCHICGSYDNLHIDHDHACCDGVRSCGKCIRGILCRNHNQGLGSFRDDPEALIAAAEYLRRHATLPIDTN
jgi:hypothetical protein